VAAAGRDMGLLLFGGYEFFFSFFLFLFLMNEFPWIMMICILFLCAFFFFSLDGREKSRDGFFFYDG
jgi:hypothetical protein